MARKGTFAGFVVLTVVATASVIGVGWVAQGFGWHLSSRLVLDAATGAFCLAWLIVLLKAPWDLYFEARAVLEDMRASRARGVTVDAAREGHVRTVSRRLLALAIGAHFLSAGLVAAIAQFSGGQVGFWFAGFFAISTVFRPAVSGYRHLWAWLRELRSEVRYPREDVLAMREEVTQHSLEMHAAREEIRDLRASLATEQNARERETRELREGQASIAREFESTLARLTDNQEVIKGIQAFVRLIGDSSARTR